MRQRDRRRQVEANRLCGKQPAMPGDEDAIDIDEQRIGKSKLPNGSRDFGDRFFECVRAFRDSGLMLFVGR
jgi:hypothetical protein